MAIEVVKDKSSLAKEAAEDDVLWSIKVALDIVNTLNVEHEPDTVSNDVGGFNSNDSLAIAALLLEQYKDNKSNA